jgi:hypothetical protein
MRMKLTEHSDSAVTLSYDDDFYPYKRRTERYIGNPGEYIYLVHDDGHTTQPCEHSLWLGNTLIRTGGTLADVIRREWRKGRRYMRDFYKR